MIAQLQSESRQLIRSVIELVYYMRGAISYGDMMLLTHTERQMINEFLEEHLEGERKKPYPQY